MSLLENMPHTVTHTRQTYTTDTLMGSLKAETTAGTDIDAWVQLGSQGPFQEMQRRDQKHNYTVYLQEDPGLQVGDLLRVTDGPTFVGKILKILSFTDVTAGIGLSTGVLCEEARTE